MGRKIFKEHGFNVHNRVASFEDFKIFYDNEGDFKINPEHNEKIIQNAERWLTREFPVLIASDYMMFKRDGNRSIYEGKYFPRRDGILALALGEAVERKGRFTDKLVDLLWMILEETTWVIPAHNPSKYGVNTCLPYAFPGGYIPDYIDLFSATTAADLSVVYYLCHDIFDEVTPLLNERLLYELNRRIVVPFLNPMNCSAMWWTGVNGNSVNNWNPWIIGNVLTVCALTVKDLPTREAIVANSIEMLDNFTKVYHSDGGCDEGPSYWGAACAALFKDTLVLYDLTKGYVNINDDDLFKKMGEYECKVCINGNRFLNFADSPAKVNPSAILLYEWGKVTNSEMMRTFGANRLNGNLMYPSLDSGAPYASLRFLALPKVPKEDYIAPTKFWLDGIIIAGTRETTKTDEGLYLALKGGNNNESHNHNDIGTIMVFADGKPIFLDAGSGRYTKRTFSSERYTIWAMSSDYHNVPTINGVIQKNGGQYTSSDHVYDEKTGKLQMSLKNAYPKEANIETYTRSAVLENSVVTIEDKFVLTEEGDIVFNFICDSVPTDVTNNTFVLHGRTITFDDSLEYSCEQLDKSYQEVEGIPGNWDVEYLYRVQLSTKSKIKNKDFVLTVK